MKILLINPTINFKKFGKFGKLMEPVPCIGISYLAAVLEKEGFKVEVIDDFVLQLGEEGILKKIKVFNPDVVGISCLTPSANITFALSKKIKEFNKKIKIILGNIHAHIFAEEILKDEPVDVVVHNEGEWTLLEIVKCFETNSDFKNVKGITFKTNGEIIKTENRPLIEDLDSLPYPAWHLFPYEKYGLFSFVDVKKPALTIATSRGCPYRCKFCSLIISKKYRSRKLEKVIDEISYLVDRFKAKQIGFIDPTFPISKKQGMDFCERMINRGLNKKIIWTSETRVDVVDKELLKVMKEAGCPRILFGIESGVQELLDNISKGFTLEQARSAVKAAKEVGMETVGFFMLGLPGETKELSQQTINFAKEIDLDFAKFALTVPLPGSALYETLRNEGKLTRKDWENFTTFNPEPKNLIYVPEGMKPKELIQMQRTAHIQFYLRPKMILRQLLKIRTLPIKDILYGVYSLITSKVK